jgi:DeoR/GlpR family transcriptional regulator of sugar metabolism
MTDRDARSFAPERHEAILRLLEEDGRVVSAQVAARLGVSIDTLRRDLAELEGDGMLRRVHGGAVRPAGGLPPLPRSFADRAEQPLESRGVVADLAVPLVGAGEVVAVGGGTTTLHLARRLPRDLEATVVTTSPDVALALRDHHGIAVDVLGGRLDRVSQTLTGPDTIEQLRRLRPDAAFIGACAVDANAGVTLREREEALVVRAMVERAARVVVLASTDKLGTSGAYVVAAPTDVDVLVTDAPRDTLAPYADLGVALVTPDGHGGRAAARAGGAVR